MIVSNALLSRSPVNVSCDETVRLRQNTKDNRIERFMNTDIGKFCETGEQPALRFLDLLFELNSRFLNRQGRFVVLNVCIESGNILRGRGYFCTCIACKNYLVKIVRK